MMTELEGYINNFLGYDSLTGIVFWKKSPGKRVKIGDRAGSCEDKGYRRIRINKKNYRAGRVAWFIYFGEWPKEQIDHINRVKSDDRIANLRDVSNFINQQNKSTNKSGVRGVFWHIRDKIWQSQIVVLRKSIHLGSYKKFENAVKARKSAEDKYYPTVPA